MANIETLPWSYLSAPPPQSAPIAVPVTASPHTPLGTHHYITGHAVNAMSTEIWPQVLQAGEWLALGILVVAGGMWMFGNREPALRRLIDMAIGYEVIRHAPAIVKWLDQF